jgi:hypothetical protein
MEQSFARIAPLVEQLHRFCRGHEEGDGGAAAAGMLAWLRGAWPDVPEIELPDPPAEDESAERLALCLVRDIGELAGMLLEDHEVEQALGWARANLSVEVERYLSQVKS